MRASGVIRIVLFLVIAVLLSSILNGVEYVLLVVAAVLIHEAGHMICAKALGVPSKGGDANLFGLSLYYDFSSVSYLREVAVSSAGAAANIAACAVTFFASKSPGTYAVFFIFSNLSLALFNLIPVSPLDGSGILTALISMAATPRRAERIAAWISAVFSFAFFVFCLYVQLKVGANLSLMFISVFLLYRAADGAKN